MRCIWCVIFLPAVVSEVAPLLVFSCVSSMLFVDFSRSSKYRLYLYLYVLIAAVLSVCPSLVLQTKEHTRERRAPPDEGDTGGIPSKCHRKDGGAALVECCGRTAYSIAAL